MMRKDKKFFTVQDMVLISVFVSFISVCSLIQIPTTPIPVTLQTFGVFVAAGVLGLKKGTMSIVAYILLGVAGVPVFRGTGGPGVIAGPTGGFIIGFIFAVIIIGVITYFIKTDNAVIDTAIMMISMIVGDIVCFAIGTVQFVFVTDAAWVAAVSYCVLPFIIPDLIKIIFAVLVANRVKKNIRSLK